MNNLINIEINPIEFRWTIEKCMIDAFGKKNYMVKWKIYDTKNVQTFNPMMILKVRKNVSEISANATCEYKLKTGLFSADIKATPRKLIKIYPS
jgi:hypothetical protein